MGEGLSRSVAIVVAYGACAALFELPFSLARTFGLEARFGFNRTSVAAFFVDRVKEGALELLIGVPLLYALFACLRAAPQTWWLFAYVGFLALILLMTLIYPTLIAPLFNKFTPFPDGEMKRRLELLLARCGFEARGLFVIDASKRSTRGNAYFTGFGKAKRIVFFDTLLEKHSPDEIELILAHELGHFKFGHVRQMIALSAVVAFLGFAALGWAFGPGGLASVFGLPNDPGLVFIVAMLAKDLVMHLLTPLLAWRSRKAEFEADGFAKSMTGRRPDDLGADAADPRKSGHADAGPGLRGFLLFAPAGSRARGAFAGLARTRLDGLRLIAERDRRFLVFFRSGFLDQLR